MTGTDRMRIDKTYRGDLTGSVAGLMTAHITGREGSAGYVAIEVVDAVLDGRQGRFVLQHTGTMDRGQPSLRVSIVPDSGTDGLAGIEGELTISVDDDGNHRYQLRYGFQVT